MGQRTDAWPDKRNRLGSRVEAETRWIVLVRSRVGLGEVECRVARY